MFTHSNSKQRKQKHAHSQLHKARSRQREREREKMAGGMEANKNKFIEDWGSARETLEHNFRWTRRNLALVGIFGIAVPYLVYKGIVREFVCYFSLSLSLALKSIRSHHTFIQIVVLSNSRTGFSLIHTIGFELMMFVQ